MDERASDPDYYGKGLGDCGTQRNDALLQEINAARQGESVAGICAKCRRNGLRSNSVASCRMRRFRVTSGTLRPPA